MYQTVITQALCDSGMALLEKESAVHVLNNQNPADRMDLLAAADCIIVRIGCLSGDMIRAAKNLKVIGRTGVGVDSVDVAAATELGIPVVVTPGANTHSVAEHTLAMAFALAKNLIESHTEQCRTNYAIRNAGKAFELRGKTIGFVGMGNIGREAAALCRAVGMKTVAYDPYLSREACTAAGCKYAAAMPDLLAEADFVSIHVPLTENTRNMFNRETFAQMRAGAMLINCARGGIVDEAALCEALESGRLAGAALDVTVNEPLRDGDPLLEAPNVILTPHMAAQTREAVERMAEMCVNGCMAVLRGEKWPYVADPAAYGFGVWNVRE